MYVGARIFDALQSLTENRPSRGSSYSSLCIQRKSCQNHKPWENLTEEFFAEGAAGAEIIYQPLFGPQYWLSDESSSEKPVPDPQARPYSFPRKAPMSLNNFLVLNFFRRHCIV